MSEPRALPPAVRRARIVHVSRTSATTIITITIVRTIAVSARPSCTRRPDPGGDPSAPAIGQAVSSIVLVNPPAEVRDEPGVSVLRGGVLPLKSRTMRGAVLGGGYGGDAGWIGEAARVVLPGLRVAGQGPDPAPEQIELMASAGGVWVGTPRR